MSQDFDVKPIGYIQTINGITKMEILPDYRDALLHLHYFSHIILIWYQGNQRQDGMIFADRHHASHELQLTTVEIQSVDNKKGIVEVSGLIVDEKITLLDIKPFIPISDRLQKVNVPETIEKEGNWWQASQSTQTGMIDSEIYLNPIGKVSKHDRVVIQLSLNGSYDLTGLEEYSHVRIVWWFDRTSDERYRTIKTVNPPYENAPRTGIFSTRSPVRPNPIGITLVRLVSVNSDTNQVEVDGLDAFADTPVFDIVPYIPVLDRVRDYSVAPWMHHWPKWVQNDISNVMTSSSLKLSPIQRLHQLGSQAEIDFESREEKEFSHVEAVSDEEIRIVGARTHNLRNVDITIPKNKLVVITGVSGSGKSSLAFDTIFAEANYLYLNGMSTIVRSILGQLERGEVDYISGLSAPIAIEQKPISRNPRSSVGSYTDIYNYLRFLYARIGTPHCPVCGQGIVPTTPKEIATALSLLEEENGLILSPIHYTSCQDLEQQLHDLQNSDYNKLQVDGVVTSAKDIDLDKIENEQIHIQIANFDSAEDYSKLLDKVKQALNVGNGEVTIKIGDELLNLSQHLQCPNDGFLLFELTASMFSYNSPDGICEDCNGLGQVIKPDPNLLVSFPELSLLDGASRYLGVLRKKKLSGNWMLAQVYALAEKHKVDLETPWKDLPETYRYEVLYGNGDEILDFSYTSKTTGRTFGFNRPAEGLVSMNERLFKKTNSEASRAAHLQFMSKRPCDSCQGERLNPISRFVTVGGIRYPEIAQLSIGEASTILNSMLSQLDGDKLQIASDVMANVLTRLRALQDIGLHYLGLDRSISTLSGGEAQRVRLASQLKGNLVGLLYVLDEPTIGLHPRDKDQMIRTLQELKHNGNSVLVVEHDEAMMKAADYIIDLGPCAGDRGGQILAFGTPKQVMDTEGSITGQYLSGTLTIEVPKQKNGKITDWLELKGASLHNLKEIDVKIPLQHITCVTGVSGAGKSSLVSDILYTALDFHFTKKPGSIPTLKSISGMEHLSGVVNISQEPIGRTPRSVPITYVDGFDIIRKLFVGTPIAKEKKYKVSHFSFNSKEGQCPECKGFGKTHVEMSFMPSVWLHCRECDGLRYMDEILEVRYKDKNIAEVLDMEVNEALSFFSTNKKLARILEVLNDVGLGYIKLGQSALTLSGGEAQRVKLAKELSRTDNGNNLYILDEPTTGLHAADIQNLLSVLLKLQAAGNTIVIIEHNLDIIKTADWIIDLGPEGGEEGGRVMYMGSVDGLKQIQDSYTAQFL